MNKDTHGHSGEKWFGFDLDGTLAKYDGWKGIDNIGKEVEPLIAVAKLLHKNGKKIKIFTARVADEKQRKEAKQYIDKWCKKTLGFCPEVTHEKDALMDTCFDDRSIQIIANTGIPVMVAFAKAMELIKALTDGYTNTQGHVVEVAELIDLYRKMCE